MSRELCGCLLLLILTAVFLFACSILPAILIIGITTFIFSAVGVKLGCKLGCKFEKGADINNFDSLMVQLAWVFVILRIIHSLVQLTFNMVLVRFLLFAAGWIIIAYMAFSQLFV